MQKIKPEAIRSKIEFLLPYIALPLLIAALFFLVADTTSMPVREVYGENGVWDLRGFDFENYNAMLVGKMAYIPKVLLSPGEFSAYSDEIHFTNVGETIDVDFLTSRDTIFLPNDGWFTFTRNSVTYAYRQYVNGVWLSDTGRGSPGYSRESEIPDTGRIIFTVKSSGDAIELVQQSSNFVHRQGNRHWAWQVGAGTGLVYESRADDFQQGIVMGSFFLLFLLFLLLFFMTRRDRAALYFSLFCVMWFLRVSVMGERAFTVLAPWLSWHTKFRIEYIAFPAAAILTLAIIDALFPKILSRNILRVFYAVSAGLIVLYALADTAFMSRVGLAAYSIFGLGISYVIVRFAHKVRNTNSQQRIFIAGMVLFLFSAVSDIVLFSFYNRGLSIVPFEITGMAVLIFALCEAAAVFISNMKKVEEARENEKRLASENLALDTLSRMKTEFLATISHEMKTPLMVMGGYAELSQRQIKEGLANEKTLENLQTVFVETQRLSELVDELLKNSVTKNKTVSRVGAEEIIRKVAAMCKPVLETSNNRLSIEIEKNCPPIKANPDMIIQIFFNLVSNANRHVRSDTIEISAKREGSMVLFNVKDNGKGISPELADKIFHRGVSGDGGTGLGLHICKETVEAHGGAIGMENGELRIENGKEVRGGVSVWFTLPVYGIEN